MKKVNNSTNHGLRFIIPNSEIVIEQFYNSWDKQYHLAEYIPYKQLPKKYLCNKTGNFSPSRKEYKRNICKECFDILKEYK